jgi:hypothetical protein
LDKSGWEGVKAVGKREWKKQRDAVIALVVTVVDGANDGERGRLPGEPVGRGAKGKRGRRGG